MISKPPLIMKLVSFKCLALVATLAIAIKSVQATENDSDDSESSIKDKIVEVLLQNPASDVANFALDHIDYTTTKYMYDIYEGCLGGCWKYVMSEEDLNDCISSKNETCSEIKDERAKDLLIYYAKQKALQVTKNQVKSMLHLKSKTTEEDQDLTLKEKAVETGVNIAKSAIKSKATSLAVDAIKDIFSSSSRRKRSVDSDSTLKEKAIDQGLKIAKSAIKKKATNLAVDAGKKAIINAISKSSRRKRDVDSDSTLKDKAVNKGLNIAKSAIKKKAANLAVDAGAKAIKNAISKSSRRKREVTGKDYPSPSLDLIESLRQRWVAAHQSLKESSDNIRKEVESEIKQQWLSLESGKSGLKSTVQEAHTQSVDDAKKLLNSWLAAEKKLLDILKNVTTFTSEGTKSILSEFAYTKGNVSDSLDTLPLKIAIEVGELLENWLDSGKAVVDSSDKAIEKTKLGVDKLLDLISESQKNLSESAENAQLSSAVQLGKLLEILMDSGKDLSETLKESQSQTKAGADRILNTLSEALSKLPKIAEDAVKVTVDNLANPQPDIVLV